MRPSIRTLVSRSFPSSEGEDGAIRGRRIPCSDSGLKKTAFCERSEEAAYHAAEKSGGAGTAQAMLNGGDRERERKSQACGCPPMQSKRGNTDGDSAQSGDEDNAEDPGVPPPGDIGRDGNGGEIPQTIFRW